MNNYKPYAYLYKHSTDDKYLKVCFIVQIPIGKKITLRAGDPDTDGNKTTIRYNIENDNSQLNLRTEHKQHQFDWDGNAHEVEIIVGDGSGNDGGKVAISNEIAEEE